MVVLKPYFRGLSLHAMQTVCRFCIFYVMHFLTTVHATYFDNGFIDHHFEIFAVFSGKQNRRHLVGS